MKSVSLTTTLVLLTVAVTSVYGAEDIPPPPSLDNTAPPSTSTTEQAPSPLPGTTQDSREIPEPEVRIIKRKDAVIEEYRVNGKLRYVKITPAKGKPYYMYDSNGDGVLESREDDLANPPINRWKLLEW